MLSYSYPLILFVLPPMLSLPLYSSVLYSLRTLIVFIMTRPSSIFSLSHNHVPNYDHHYHQSPLSHHQEKHHHHHHQHHPITTTIIMPKCSQHHDDKNDPDPPRPSAGRACYLEDFSPTRAGARQISSSQTSQKVAGEIESVVAKAKNIRLFKSAENGVSCLIYGRRTNQIKL